MPDIKKSDIAKTAPHEAREGSPLAAASFATMHLMHDEREYAVKEVLKENHGLGAESLEDVPKALGRAAFGIAFAVELKPAVEAAWHGDSVKTEAAMLEALGYMGGAVIGMEAGGVVGTAAIPIPFVGTGVGAIGGGYVGAKAGKLLMEELTKEMHKEYGENNTIALGMLHHAYAKLEPHFEEALHAAQNGIERLEHPTSQRLLDETRQAAQQTLAAHEVTKNVDISLAAPVLNTMQTWGHAQTVAEAAHELQKMGPVSELTYGKAARDMASLISMGEKFTPEKAADFLHSKAEYHAVPQYEMHASAGLPTDSLARRAEHGDIGAQYALLSQSSLVFSPRNDAAADRLATMVAEMSHNNTHVDWKSLEAQLDVNNRQLTQRAAEASARITAIASVTPSQTPAASFER